MRPLRLLLSLSFCVFSVIALLYASRSSSHPRPVTSSRPSSATERGFFRALFSFHAPSSLFPPSAAISLTDDNSTFFLARPAAFGPSLPLGGLSGQLWIGSGFSDENFDPAGIITGAEGELGCSDVPGWSYNGGKGGPTGGADGEKRNSGDGGNSGPDHQEVRSGRSKRSNGSDKSVAEGTSGGEDDGTDDHLSEPFTGAEGCKDGKVGTGTDSEHADIQSLQESAEIAGKVVLLSRGGCGFLEKAKWVQRRGGIALVVGDNVRGGPLVTMYARGDTNNITVPAIFTSYTTAHLLSSLVPFGDHVHGQSSSVSGNSKSGSEETRGEGAHRDAPDGSRDKDHRTFTRGSGQAKATATSKSGRRKSSPNAHNGKVDRKQSEPPSSDRGFFSSLLSLLGFGGDNYSIMQGDNRRPPSSGSLDWVMVEEFSDDKGKKSSTAAQKNNQQSKSKAATTSTGDNFMIGVQDWRDPDLVAAKGDSADTMATETQSVGRQQGKAVKEESAAHDEHLKGGSITPGSGVYEKPSNDPKDIDRHSDGRRSNDAEGQTKASADDSNGGEGWLSHLPWNGGGDGKTQFGESDSRSRSTNAAPKAPKANSGTSDSSDSDQREGLWVTLTLTSMSSSPFFDTLLVLVVSPLVTLTVVYALLLLRSRIRRRRWRAPKSVVERLPVRTYHTLSSESSSASSLATSMSSSPTTPLLHSSSRSVLSRSRPRARTTSEVPGTTHSPIHSERVHSPSSEREKTAAGLAEWRRRYGGRQRECVVCLEEYVDGVSRVMSLPCGHEFHAECITPWLTTRRRTCPICKGDVVRSMAQGGASGERQPAYHDHSDEDIQTRAVESRNDSPSAAEPVPTEGDDYTDIDRAQEASASTGSAENFEPRVVWRRLANIARSLVPQDDNTRERRQEAAFDRTR